MEFGFEYQQKRAYLIQERDMVGVQFYLFKEMVVEKRCSFFILLAVVVEVGSVFYQGCPLAWFLEFCA